MAHPEPVSLPQLPEPPGGRAGWPWSVESSPPLDWGDVAWPRITVVTPSFQQAPFLEECIRSVLLQNYPNLEYIVNDGGSSDGSAEIVQRYADFLAHWQSKKDAGQGDAINQGFARATGEILGWVNSDDLLLPGALFAVAREFMGGTADIVYGDALNLFEEDGALQYWQGYWIRPSFLQFGGIISSHAVYWRRSAHQPIWTELGCNIDGELWQRLVPGRRLRYLPAPLGVCRIHAQTKSNSEQWRERWRRDDELIWARHGRPTTNRYFRKWFTVAQRAFKWVTWRLCRERKRAVIAACQWTERRWRGPRP